MPKDAKSIAKKEKAAVKRDVARAVEGIASGGAPGRKFATGYSPDVAVSRPTAKWLGALHRPWDPSADGASVPTSPALPCSPIKRYFKGGTFQVPPGSSIGGVAVNPLACLVRGIDTWNTGGSSPYSALPCVYTDGNEATAIVAGDVINDGGSGGVDGWQGIVANGELVGYAPSMDQVANKTASVRLVAGGLRARRTGESDTAAGRVIAVVDPNHHAIWSERDAVPATYTATASLPGATSVPVGRDWVEACYLPIRDSELMFAVGTQGNMATPPAPNGTLNPDNSPVYFERVAVSGIPGAYTNRGLLVEGHYLAIYVMGATAGDTYEFEFFVHGEYIGSASETMGTSRRVMSDPVGIDAAMTVVDLGNSAGSVGKSSAAAGKETNFLRAISDVVASGTHVVAGAANTIKNIADAGSAVRNMVRARKVDAKHVTGALGMLSRPLVQDAGGDLVPILSDAIDSVGNLILG